MKKSRVLGVNDVLLLVICAMASLALLADSRQFSTEGMLLHHGQLHHVDQNEQVARSLSMRAY